MTTIKHKFSTSVNIKRDWDANINYIPTPNSRLVFSQILNDALLGIRSFNIIGAYGSGKSSFLVAFQKNLEGKKNYFSESNGLSKQFPTFEYIPIIGAPESLTDLFAVTFGLDSKLDYKTSDIIKAIDKHYKTLEKKGKGLAIFIDEFGKFLEYAAKNNPESELYFVQQLAELVNDPNKNILFINTLHQDFNTYSNSLSKAQKQEWDKVKGRLKEITFNEPVEQLLFLASERVQEKFEKTKHPDKNLSKLFSCIRDSKTFPLKDYLSENFAAKLFPFDILSASVLTLSLQKYGQNERSLFSFLESNDPHGINEFDSKFSPFYNIASVYDYLSHNYYSFLNSKANPHFTQWMVIKSSIEKIDDRFEGQEATIRLLKTIGLLNIFASASARLDNSFLCDYAKYAIGIKHPETILKQLEAFKIIRFVSHSFKYILFEGTDVDIELEIDRAGNLVEKVTNVVNSLNEHFEFPFIQAKQVSYEKGTPRLFQFKLSENPITQVPEGEVDGFINLIFSENVSAHEVKKTSSECEEAIIYGYYTNTSEIRKLLFEIKKINRVINDNAKDKIAVRELKSILEHQVKLLNHYVLGSFYSGKDVINWYYKGKSVLINDRQILNKMLSSICNDVYKSTPIYRNEMVNKTKISSQISSARKNLVNATIENYNLLDLGLDSERFPPEKTVYLSLMRETGIHRKIGNEFTLAKPIDSSFDALWDECVRFINSTKDGRRGLHELVETLFARPFKLKKGFIDFWLPLFLIIKKDDYALYGSDGYIPEMSGENVDLILKEPRDFEIKAFDVAGIKLELFSRYRTILNQPKTEKFTNKIFIETIKPFIVFYKKDLLEYTRKTKRFKHKSTIAFRDAIAKSTDPEKTFFEDFPSALGYSTTSLKNSPALAEEYIKALQESIRELRTCYDELLNRFESYLTEDLLGYKSQFPAYKDELKLRYKKLKKHLLLPQQKVFHGRILSELDERKAWLNLIAQACIGKTLDVFNDDDEKILFEKIREMIYELDNLCDLSKSDIDSEKEEVMKLEMTSFVKGLSKNLIRLPKSKDKVVQAKTNEIKNLLGNDKQINIAILAKLLQELLAK